MVKNTTSLYLHKNDSVKNKLIIRNAKEKRTKSYYLISFFRLTNCIITINKNLKLSNQEHSEHIDCGNSFFDSHH